MALRRSGCGHLCGGSGLRGRSADTHGDNGLEYHKKKYKESWTVHLASSRSQARTFSWFNEYSENSLGTRAVDGAIALFAIGSVFGARGQFLADGFEGLLRRSDAAIPGIKSAFVEGKAGEKFSAVKIVLRERRKP